ncbi:MAG: OmpA family protein [Gallionellaceae bacterium]|nr:OmpA family protein [Gallionellaceae bacterium]
MSRTFLHLFLAIGLAGVFGSAWAETANERWYLAPTIGYVFADSDRKADDGWGLGLALGKPLNEKWNLELTLRGNKLDRAAGGAYDQYGLGVDGLYFFKRDPAFAPFALVGAGYLRSDVPSASDNSLMANAGLGFLKRLSDNMDLRADARYRWANNNLPGVSGNGLGDWLVSIGLNIALGEKAAAAVAVSRPEPVMAKAAPRLEPVMVKQETKSEPKQVEAAPTPEVVAAQLKQAKPGDVVVVLRGVNFDFDSARLRPEAFAILDEAARVLGQRDKLKVDIVGHTCSIGTEKYNQGLSERRARSVYNYFLTKALSAGRFGVKGYGETRPAADNATRAGREQNRRVELHIVD